MQQEFKKTILLVEDMAIIAMAEANKLKHNGFDVVIAYNGTEAVKLASENSNIDLILMDIDLGKGIDGTEAAQIILKNQEIPIVFLSNHTEKEIVEKTEKITSYGYVVKNSGETVLLASIKMAFKLFEAHHQMLESEMKLIESDRKFHTLEKQIDDVIWTMDMNFRYTYVSPSIEKMNGYKVDEMMKLNLQDYLTEDSAQEIINILAEEISSYLKNMIEENIITIELEQIKKDGTIFPTEIKARFLLDNYNNPTGIIGVTRDISERQKSREALLESRKALDLTLEGAQIGFWDSNYSTGKVYRSEIWASMLGYSLDEIENSPEFWRDLIHPDDFERVLAEVRKHEAGECEYFNIEHRIRTKSGNYKWILDRGKVFERSDSGKPIRAMGVHIDIDKRIAVEQRLLETNRTLNLALEGAQIGLWDQNFKTGIVNRSDHWATMLGYDPDEIKNNLDFWKSNIHPDDLEKALGLAKRHERGLSEFYKVQHRLKCKNGNYKWVLNWGKISERDSDGQPVRALGIHLDIDDTIKAEEALKKNEEKISSIFRVAPIGIGVTSNRVILELNDYIFTLLGYTSKELVGKSTRILYPTEEEFALVGKEKDKQIELFGTCTVETKWVCKDGRMIDVLLSLTPLNLKEISGGITFTALDITRRKKSEEALRKSQERFALAQRSADIGSWEWNILIGEVSWSETIEPMFGFSKGEFDGTYEAYLKCIHPEDVGYMMERINAAVYKNEEYKNLEFRIIWPNGTIRWILANGIVYSDDNVRPNRMIGIVQDITEQKQYQHKIIESERKLSTSLQIAKMGHWEYDVIKNQFNFNDQYYQLHEITAEEVGGYQMSAENFAANFVHPDEAFKVAKAIENAILTNDPDFQLQIESRIITANKESRWINIWFKVVKDEKGKTIKLLGVNQDIDERKKVEEKLRFTQFAVDHTIEQAYWVNSEGKFVYVNEAACNVTGYSKEELLNLGAVGLAPGFTQEMWAEHWLELKQRKKILFELTHRTKNGRDYPVEISTNYVIFEGVEYNCAFVRDITERKLVENNLKQSEENYRRFFQEDLSGVFLSTPEGGIKTCNQAYVDMMEYESIEELIKSNPVSHYPQSQQRIDFLNLLRKEKKLTNYEGELVTKNGKHIQTLENILGVFDDKENLVEFWGYVNDITDRKKAEQILKNAAREKEALHRELLHRVKNSFNLIKSLMFLEREKLDNKEAKKILENLEMRIGTLSKMYTLLNMSGISQHINLGEYLNQITKSLTESYVEDSDSIEIKSSFDKIEISPRDASSVGLIVNEILTNSLKYAFPDNKKGNISISLKAINGNLEIEIADDGIGVSDNFNINDAKGMGLQLINMLTRQLNGTVTVEANNGTRFKIVFPLEQ